METLSPFFQGVTKNFQRATSNATNFKIHASWWWWCVTWSDSFALNSWRTLKQPKHWEGHFLLCRRFLHILFQDLSHRHTLTIVLMHTSDIKCIQFKFCAYHIRLQILCVWHPFCTSDAHLCTIINAALAYSVHFVLMHAQAFHGTSDPNRLPSAVADLYFGQGMHVCQHTYCDSLCVLHFFFSAYN